MNSGKLLFIFFAFLFVFAGITSAGQFGDPTKFALQFDDQTGNLSAIVYKGETVTLPTDDIQRFDILQDKKWAFGLAGGKLEFVESFCDVNVASKKEHDITVDVTQKIGDWTAKTKYSFDYHEQPATLKRSVELTYNGSEPTKIRNFWMSLPLFPFENDETQFLHPGQYPPRTFKPDNFKVGEKQRIWRSGAPLVFQLDQSKSVLLFSDQLVEYADWPGGDVYRNGGVSKNKGGLRLVQSFDTKRHVKPGDSFKIGDAYFRIVDGDAESALLQLHDLMRDIGHVVPADRPEWFKEAIAYSMHPGGTTGSNCRDLGGFLPTLEMLPRIKEIGCNVIWFMPLEDKSIYWPRDYYKLQSGLGSTDEKAPEEYKAVVDKAHELGMRVVQDSVPHGGSNTNQRAKEHPYWLAQNEDGSTLDYWCFDFNWPSWIDYMAEVSRFYTKTYGIDGFRIDACGGSKIPNWNPEVPYDRASHSQSQGGLNMVRAIRKALKDEKPDGATLAEVNGSLFGAVSDAVYDFDLCYNILHDCRKLAPEEFVKRLRRWLHEQQYSEIPDLLRLRHVESHDSLRAQLWYGTEPHRALVALTAFIHGIPLVYHEQEIGHGPQFKGIFETRKALPELNGGAADYLCVDAPPGIFACLRSKGDDASVILINFNERSVDNFEFSVPLEKLPDSLQQTKPQTAQVGLLTFTGLLKEGWYKTDIRAGRFFSTASLPPFDAKVLMLRKEIDETQRQSLTKMFQKGVEKFEGPKNFAEIDGAIKLELENKYVAYIDSNDGLLVRMDRNGKPTFGKSELFLSPEILSIAGKTTVEQTSKGIEVKKQFDDSTLEIIYSKAKRPKPQKLEPDQYFPYLQIESRWVGKNVPKNLSFSFPVVDVRIWNAAGLVDVYYPRHLHTDGFYGSIYWRPQGTNVVYDSILNPSQGNGGCFFATENGMFGIDFEKHLPRRLRLLDRIGDRQELSVLISLADDEADIIPGKPEFKAIIGGFPEHQEVDKRYALNPVAGGWIFENDYYKLRLARNGQIMSLDSKEKDGSLKNIVHQADIYSDYGYGKEKTKYAASFDVETGIRIVQDDDGTLRLRFEGQLRGFYRFDLLKPPIEFFTEYALNDGPAFGFSCGVKSSRLPADSKGFLALMLPMPQVDGFDYFKEKQSIAQGNSVDVKGRSFECKDHLPDCAVLKNSDKALLEFREIQTDATNLFLDRQNFFVTFDDGDRIGLPSRWRSLSATVRIAANPEKIAAPKVFRDRGSDSLKSETLGEGQTTGNLILDGGFESQSGDNDLVAIRSGAVLKGLKQSGSAWNIPDGGSFSTTEFHGGSASVQVVGEAEQYRLFGQNISLQNLKPGTKLRLSAWVKGRDLKAGPIAWQIACVRFAFWIEGEKQTRYFASPTLTESFDWKQVCVEFVVPEKLTGLLIQAGNNGGTGTVWVDDVRLEIISTKGN